MSRVVSHPADRRGCTGGPTGWGPGVAPFLPKSEGSTGPKTVMNGAGRPVGLRVHLGGRAWVCGVIHSSDDTQEVN